MFAHDLYHSQIEYLVNSVDLNRKDRAKRYHKSSIFIRQYSIPACPGWVYKIRHFADPGMHCQELCPVVSRIYHIDPNLLFIEGKRLKLV